MTVSTLSNVQPATYTVPGVYQAPSPRAPTVLPIRTDVAGFIGFEPRVRDSTPPSQLTGGATPVGHAFAVDVNEFQLRSWGIRATVPATPQLVLSESASSIPLADGQSIVYAIAASARSKDASLIVAHGAVAPSGLELAPDNPTAAAAVAAFMMAEGDNAMVAASRRWVRVADISVRRSGTSIWLTVLPSLKLTRCDDWNDYLAAFGMPRDDGTLLGPAVEAFFANGGGRCYLSCIRRPNFNDRVELDRASQDMIGVKGSSQAEATGLERLLLVDEVSIIDAPDLYARGGEAATQTLQLPPPAQDACFLPCPKLLEAPIIQQASGTGSDGDPLFPANLFTTDPWSDAFLSLQLQMAARCISECWRVVLLLAPPLVLNGGNYIPPDTLSAQLWRGIFDAQQKNGGLGDIYQVSCVALYFPWLLVQELVGAPVTLMPPTAAVAGVIARRDLARGPQIAPANETLDAVVGITPAIDDLVNSTLYSPLPNANGVAAPSVNIIRPFAGYGIQVWGARTLSTDPWLQFLNVRRALSAIERRCKAILETLVFEPNTPYLWMRITQSVVGVLMPIFNSGALRGDTPAQAFYVRCDSNNNPADSIAVGQLLCEVGVAIAAPAEFIVFRIGRNEGVVEVLE
ncbi:MAG TPA: hypothetical protein VGO67_23140 [Verrucomicrobiae bacterium]|jgi:hypothetical protein